MKLNILHKSLKHGHCFARMMCIHSSFFEQEDNGIPIHLKGGTKDALLYRATMILTVFGSGYVVYELFTAAMPKKPQ